LEAWRSARSAQAVAHALGRLVNFDQRLIPYQAIDKDLRSLLVQFGPERKVDHPEYPFWRLKNDGIWELTNTAKVRLRKGQSDGRRVDLLRYNVEGGFTPQVFEVLRRNPSLVSEIALEILSQNFPATVFGDILDSVGLEIQFEQALRRQRDPAFRERILVAYEFRCAVCGYDLRMKSQPVGLEAAHIKWHVNGGPDLEINGLALCSMHHKLFDLGVFTIFDDLSLRVSDRVNGTFGLREWLMCHHGRPVRKAQSERWLPSVQFLAWHREQVFRGPSRDC
jgi:putative restriction endonuclease